LLSISFQPDLKQNYLTNLSWFIETNTINSDLDPRDNFNRQINDLYTNQIIKELFISSLYMLLIEKEIHSISNMLELVKKYINLANIYLTRSIYKIIVKSVSAVLLLLKRLYLIFIVIGIVNYKLNVYPSFFIHLFCSPKSKVAPLVLRC